MNAPQILNREFLELRCRMLDLAASFDRLERAEGSVENDPRLNRLREALRILQEAHANRAEQVQLLFSRAYESQWPEQFGLSTQR